MIKRRGLEPHLPPPLPLVPAVYPAAATLEAVSEQATTLCKKDNYRFVVDEPKRLGGNDIGAHGPAAAPGTQQTAVCS